MTRYWTFRDYLTVDGKNPILDWLNSLPKAAKVKINARIEYIERLEILDRPHLGQLEGECGGLMELRIMGPDKVQYRPLCCYGPGDRELAILMGAIEKGSKLRPPSACTTARQRKQEIVERGRTCEHNFS